MEPGLHDALKDDDLVVVGAGRQRGQGLDVGGHVLQVVDPPHRSGQVGPALQHNREQNSAVNNVSVRNKTLLCFCLMRSKIKCHTVKINKIILFMFYTPLCC